MPRLAKWSMAAALILSGAPAMASTAQTPGPPLRTPVATLNAALDCSTGLVGAARSPVLLVAGTGGTPQENYSWNYMPALSARGVPWCGITVPDHTLADVQVQAEYIAYAIRAMYRRSGRRVAIVGYSQGGMTPRWPLRWWPGLRRMVDDMISLAGANHGTAFAAEAGVCATACHPAAWQNLPGSALLTALNSPVESFPGIAYTQVFTNYDELSTPPGHDGTSPLHTGAGRIANVALQDVCPGNRADHLIIGSVDPVAYALVVDALEHPGPADPARIDAAVCNTAMMPGVELDDAGDAIGAVPFLLSAATPFNVSGVEKVTEPPSLRGYTERPQVTARQRPGGRLRLDVLAGVVPVMRLRIVGNARSFVLREPRTRWTVRTRIRPARSVRLIVMRADGHSARIRLRFRRDTDAVARSRRSRAQ